MLVEIVKFCLIAFGYFVAGPVSGIIMAQHRRLEDAGLFLLVFLTGLSIDTTVLMLGSIEWYRGVVKGYEFTLMEMLAIGLLTCRLMRGGLGPFRWMPVFTIVWALYCAASMLSVASAVQVDYVFMALVRFGKVWLLALAVANYVRDEERVHLFLMALCVMLWWQWGAVVKMKFIDGVYQVRGLFEHQNPLAIFTYMAALPVLSAGLSPATGQRKAIFYVLTFGAAGFIVLATLSRAALAFFAMGTVATVAWGFIDRFTWRRVFVVTVMTLGGAVVLAATLDTIIARFNDEGNEASGETREVMNLASQAMVDANPLGIGWNGFGKAINHPYPYGDVIDDWNRERGQEVNKDYAKGVVESHYWLLLGETGYPGFITYMLFIGLGLLAGLWLMLTQRGRLSAAVASGIVIGFGATYVHSTLERVLTQTKNLALWMMLMGLLAVLSSACPKQGGKSKTQAPP